MALYKVQTSVANVPRVAMAAWAFLRGPQSWGRKRAGFGVGAQEEGDQLAAVASCPL